ncbi:MAG: hypothetical protein KIT10_13640 [Flavobacteriales bacterium]|nr:hypothetical protein [Flavobacteriales bacterium]
MSPRALPIPCKALPLLLALVLPRTGRAQDIGTVGQLQPVRFNAGVRAQLGFYTVQGIDPRRTPFYWTISGTPTMSVQGVQLPFLVIMSDQHREFQQPFNQFGLSPHYKWVKLHLGYRDVHFSRFTLAGHRALMAGVELDPGRFRFGFVYGRFRKAVREDTTATYDPAAFLSAVPIPSFRRSAYAVKVGIGRDGHFVDVVMLRGKDDARSIPDPVSTGLAPAENLVIGLASKLRLSERLTWEVDAATSAWTRDTRAPVADVDPAVTTTLGGLFTSRTSSAALLALETALGLRRPRARYKLSYRLVDPDYQSMGAYFFQNDVQQVTGTAVSAFLKNKLNMNLTAGWQQNNVKRQRTSTARRIIGNVGLNYASGNAFGMLVNFSNFGITQQPQRATVQDTALLRQVSRNILVQPRLHYARATGTHTVHLTANHFALNDLTVGVTNSAQLTGTHLELNYTRGWKQWAASLGGGPIHRGTESFVGRTSSAGFQINGGRQWLKEKLGTRLRNITLWNTLPDGTSGNTWQLGLDANYAASERFSFSLQLLHQVNRSRDPSIPSFTEDTGLLGLEIRF